VPAPLSWALYLDYKASATFQYAFADCHQILRQMFDHQVAVVPAGIVMGHPADDFVTQIEV